VLASGLNLDPAFSVGCSPSATRGLVSRTPSRRTGGNAVLALTERGRAEFAALDRKSQHDTAAQLATLSDADQRRLVEAMAAIETLLGRRTAAPAVSLRPFRAGDLGVVLSPPRRALWRGIWLGPGFEALVAQSSPNFCSDFDPRREACWIAELDGEPVGSIALMNAATGIAKLRLPAR